MSKDDCYFYYYSTCLKGDKCPYRHCSAALGNETMCLLWLQGKCVDINCQNRHMKIDKARNELPCYFEMTPSGCLKPHCPFLHSKPRKFGSGEKRMTSGESGSGAEGRVTHQSHPAADPSSDTLDKDDHVNPFKSSMTPLSTSNLKNFSFELAKVKSNGNEKSEEADVQLSQSLKMKARAERFKKMAAAAAAAAAAADKQVIDTNPIKGKEVVVLGRAERLALLKKRWEARKRKEEEKKKKKKKKKGKEEEEKEGVVGAKIEKIVWEEKEKVKEEKEEPKKKMMKIEGEGDKLKAVRIKRSGLSSLPTATEDRIVVKSLDEIMREKRASQQRQDLQSGTKIDIKQALPPKVVPAEPKSESADPTAPPPPHRRRRLSRRVLDVPAVTRKPPGGVALSGGNDSARVDPINKKRDIEEDALDDLESAMKEFSGGEEAENSVEDDHDDLMLDIEEVMNI